MSLGCFLESPYVLVDEMMIRDRDLIDWNSQQAVLDVKGCSDQGLLDIVHRATVVSLQKWASCVLFERILSKDQVFDEKIFCEVFEMVLKTSPEVRESIFSNVSCYFIRLLNPIDLENPEFLRIYSILNHLTSQSVDLTQVKSLIRLKISSKLFKTCLNIRNSHNFEGASSLIFLSSKLKLINLTLEREINLLISTILDTLIDIYDLDQIKGLTSTIEEGSSKIIENLSFIKVYDPINPSNLSKITKIESFLHFEVPALDSSAETESRIPLNSSLPSLPSILWRAKSIYKRSLNDFKVSVFLGSLPTGDLIAKKIYKFTSNEKYEKMIQNEIQTLESLSLRSSPSNCFLKFFGSKNNSGCVELFMEAHEKTLKTFLEDRSGEVLPRETSKKFISNLLSFFAELQTLGIFHRDIKPSNILVTRQEALKVIDFGTASKMDQSDVTMQHDVQGTQNYMAPELFEDDGTCLKSGKYRPEKSDVYSLGVTFFELIQVGLVSGIPGGRERFRRDYIKLISCLNADLTVKSLLKRMLEPSYALRPDFKECLSILNDDETGIN